MEYCCVFSDNESRVFQQFSGYHGFIAVDPKNGAILRVTLQADLKPSDPLVRSDILVEYSPVEIGGKTYICPVKSVSISLAPALPTQCLRDTALPQHGRGKADFSGTPADFPKRCRLCAISFVSRRIANTQPRTIGGTNGIPPASGAGELSREAEFA